MHCWDIVSYSDCKIDLYASSFHCTEYKWKDDAKSDKETVLHKFDIFQTVL
jgi:hypothetical protein